MNVNLIFESNGYNSVSQGELIQQFSTPKQRERIPTPTYGC